MHHHHQLPALSLDAFPSSPHLHVAPAAASSSKKKARIRGIWLQRSYLQGSCVFSSFQLNSYSRINPCRAGSGTPPDLRHRSERVPEKRVNGSSQAESDAEKVRTLRNSKVYPIMRTYRNDLCVMVLIGDANPSQVLEAMATDGGLTAAEDIASGRDITTIETILPGHGDEHSTIATKLLAPSNWVIQRAKSSWHEKASSMYSRWALKNAIARAFEVVVMTELLKFELCIQSPGSFRNMNFLPNEKIDVVARLESSDLNDLKGISETVFSYMMAGLSQELGMDSRSWTKPRFPWEKPQLPSLKSAFQLLPLSKAEISAHVDEKVKLFTLKEIASTEPVMASRIWWPMQKSTMLFISSKIVASESWIYDHVAVHRLVANLDVVTADVQGGHKNGSLWEIQLTHAQLVDMANMLDLYYEDRYTCQHKRLPNEHNVILQYYARRIFAIAIQGALQFCRNFYACGAFYSFKARKNCSSFTNNEG